MTEPCHGARGENLSRLGAVLYEIVDAAIAISGADFGNIQLIDPKTSDLRIVAHRGFPEWWLDFWNSVSAGHGVCGTALACGERVIVEDVEHSPIFIGTPALEIQRKAGVRAVQSTPIISRTGKPLGMFSTHYKAPRRPDERGLLLLDLLARQAADIIERKQAEEALEQTRNMLDEAQRIAHLGSFEYVAATQTTKWSEEEYRIYGLDPAAPSPEYEDLVARHIHPDDAALLHETFTEALRNNGIYELEHRIVQPDGCVRWVYDRAHPHVDADGNLLRYVGATLDITERKRAEEALRENREQLALAFKAGRSGSFEWDPQTDGNRWSDELLGLYGLKREEFGGRHEDWIARLHPEDRAAGDAAVQQALRTGEYAMEFRIRRRDTGEIRWMHGRGEVFFDAAGKPRRLIGINVDITERKAAEAQVRALNAELEDRVRERTAQLQESNEALLQSNTDLKHFAHATAHDLQTPLRSIAGFTQLLQQEVKGRVNEQVDEWSAAVVENTRRLQLLIQEILSYTRLEVQGRPFQMTDLRKLFDEVVASLAAQIGETRAEVTGSALPALPVDRTQIAQVFQNLIENGIKYNRSKPPRVALSGELQEDRWVFSVADNGIGIDPKHFDRVFALFQRLHPYHQFPGTGIGVPLCRRIVERHGGQMWIESRPGEGSTFYFSLPAERDEGF